MLERLVNAVKTKKILLAAAVSGTLIMMCVLILLPFQNKEIKLYSKGAIVVSTEKKKVLFEKNIHDKLPPASMTKLMSMLLVFEQIELGNLSYEQELEISERAAGTFASKAGLRAGEKLTVDSLLYCVFLPSGSDAVLAFAEHLYGSEERFVEAMNEKASMLKLKNTQFKNSVGLEQNGHYSSPYDIAMIAAELVTSYPQVYQYTSLDSMSIEREDGTELVLNNTNDMLEYEGVDGLKTGSSPTGGYNLAMTYNHKNKHFIAVVMGNEMPYFRKQDSKLLLETFK